MKKISISISILVFSLLFIGSAHAMHLEGYIYCDVNINGSIDIGTDTPLANVTVTATGADGSVYNTSTDATGFYVFGFPGIYQTYTLTIGGIGLPQDSQIVLPTPPPYTITFAPYVYYFRVDWLISSATCRTQSGGACWMTAGGVRFDPLLGFPAAEKGPRFNFGGNTFPGCSPTAGDGGQWSFVDRTMNIHFQAWQIDQVTCGNVEGIPPGSTSPVTPFNYIDFSGWGTIKGIAGNGAAAKKAAVSDPQKVYFFAHFEDRNEPGNMNSLPDEGAKVDRLYVRVWTDINNPNGSIVYFINGNPDPAIVDPVLITGGNIQIHISSCP